MPVGIITTRYACHVPSTGEWLDAGDTLEGAEQVTGQLLDGQVMICEPTHGSHGFRWRAVAGKIQRRDNASWPFVRALAARVGCGSG